MNDDTNMNEQGSVAAPAPQSKKKSMAMWVAIVVIAAGAAIFILWEGPAVQAPERGAEGDTVPAIEGQLDSIDVENLEEELQDIDQDLNQL
ncbi:MAG: hypothetical protein HYU81_02125 [Candidatus Brennerbacteria bacterium]|nr:hypothetical protein [Candidatus Brennerbacteria bacterium]